MTNTTSATTCPVRQTIGGLFCLVGRAGTAFSHLFLLIIRLFWGFGFFQAGLGKFHNLDRTIGFFTSLNIPMPKLNVFLAAGTEVTCGLLLLLGLASRVATVPLMVVMVIAYSTAHLDTVRQLFTDPEPFLTAAPFLFLMTVLTVFSFGPGCFSLDALIKRVWCKKSCGAACGSGACGCCTDGKCGCDCHGGATNDGGGCCGDSKGTCC